MHLFNEQEGPRVIVGPGVVGKPKMGGRQRWKNPEDAKPRMGGRRRGNWNFDPEDAMIDKLLGSDDKEEKKHGGGRRAQEKMKRMIELEKRKNRHRIPPEVASPDWNEDIAEDAHWRQKNGIIG